MDLIAQKFDQERQSARKPLSDTKKRAIHSRWLRCLFKIRQMKQVKINKDYERQWLAYEENLINKKVDAIILVEGTSLLQATPQMGEKNMFLQMLTSYEDQLTSINKFNDQVEELGTILQQREAEFDKLIERRLCAALDAKKAQPAFGGAQGANVTVQNESLDEPSF